MVFAVAPAHPLASAPGPLAEAVIAAHRAAIVADTSRKLPARNAGVLSGQDALVVPDFRIFSCWLYVPLWILMVVPGTALSIAA
jgi:hypothetical protein